MRFNPLNGTVSRKDLNKKFKENQNPNIIVHPTTRNDKFEYKNGKGEVPIDCKKDGHPKYVERTFSSLEKRMNDKKPICDKCANDKGIATKGTSNSELEIKDELVNYIQNVLGCNVDVQFGSNKAKAEYKSRSGKSFLDYDIKITDEKDGSKAFAISVLGPSHDAIYNIDVNDNDTIRAIEEYKKKRLFIVAPAVRKGDKLFDDKLKEMKDYLRIIYNKITLPKESAKMKKLTKRFGADSEQVKEYLERRNKRIEDKKSHVEDLAINQQLTKIVTALRNNIGYNRTTYNGKYNNIIDFINKEDRVKESFSHNSTEWNKLLTANKKEFDDWVLKNQAISDFDKENYGKITEKGSLKSKKLFESNKNSAN